MDRVRSYRLPPQVGQPSTTVSMMREVMITLLPTLGMAVFFFGLRVLAITALSMGACVLFEYGYPSPSSRARTCWKEKHL